MLNDTFILKKDLLIDAFFLLFYQTQQKLTKVKFQSKVQVIKLLVIVSKQFQAQNIIFVNFLIKFKMKVKLQACTYCFRNFKGQKSNSIKGVDLNKNYYKILQVDNTACQVTIKKAYFRMAKKMHPDVNPQGHTQFTEIQQAYNILCDKQSKIYYDQNNTFYPRSKSYPKTENKQEDDDLNYRSQYFYQEMKNRGYEDFRQYQKEREEEQKQKEHKQEKKQQQTQEEKQRRRIEEQIKIARMMLFSRNPIWERPNNYMNYEQRVKQGMQKQKQFEDLFAQGSKLGKFWKKFI